MICAQTRLRFQFAESRQNTTRTMGFQTKVTRGALVQRTRFIKKNIKRVQAQAER